MIEDLVVYEIFRSFKREGELPYDDMISYIMLHYEVTESNAIRLYKKAEELYDQFVANHWILVPPKWHSEWD